MMTRTDSVPEGPPRTNDAAEASARSRFVLTPHRSLGPRGFIVFMVALTAVSFAAGVVFTMMGAWPVFGFFGLDVLLIYGAFRLNYRAARLHETVDLSVDGVAIERVHPNGRRESWRFEPYWLSVIVEGDAETGATLSVGSHGRRVVLGDFLAHHEKIEFAAALRQALAAYKAA